MNPDALLGDMDDLTAVLRSIKDGMADINSDLEQLVADWDGEDERDDYADWDDTK